MRAFIHRNRGQISVVIAVIMASGTIVASVIGGWASADSRVGAVDTKVQVIEERENNHYDELSRKQDNQDKKLDAIDDKLDVLLRAIR